MSTEAIVRVAIGVAVAAMLFLVWMSLAVGGGHVSERQWRDVLSLLGMAGHLDLEYLDETACQADLTDLLERARNEVGTNSI